MPPHKNTSNPDRPCTRTKNASTHPGTAAQDALRVKAPRRDPTIIQKEKDAIKEKRALKAQEKEAKQARNEATKHIADDYRAQQASERANNEEEMLRKKYKGEVSPTVGHFLT